MEALGRLIRNAAGAFVRHTPRRESPPPSDSGSGSDGDPSTPDDSSGDDDDSARGDDPPNGVVSALQTLRISLYNPLFHSGSDGRPIKGALRMGLISTLITDEATAENLVALADR